jgi:hypothetical protein
MRFFLAKVMRNRRNPMPNCICGMQGTRRDRSAVLQRPSIVVGNDLLVIADAATQIADLGYEANLCNRCCVGARLWKHIADFSDLTFLRGGVEVRTI